MLQRQVEGRSYGGCGDVPCILQWGAHSLTELQEGCTEQRMIIKEQDFSPSAVYYVRFFLIFHIVRCFMYGRFFIAYQSNKIVFFTKVTLLFMIFLLYLHLLIILYLFFQNKLLLNLIKKKNIISFQVNKESEIYSENQIFFYLHY